MITVNEWAESGDFSPKVYSARQRKSKPWETAGGLTHGKSKNHGKPKNRNRPEDKTVKIPKFLSVRSLRAASGIARLRAPEHIPSVAQPHEEIILAAGVAWCSVQILTLSFGNSLIGLGFKFCQPFLSLRPPIRGDPRRNNVGGRDSLDVFRGVHITD